MKKYKRNSKFKIWKVPKQFTKINSFKICGIDFAPINKFSNKLFIQYIIFSRKNDLKGHYS